MSKKIYETANRLSTIRAAKKVTQDELAKITGITRVTISNYESGNSGMSLANATAIADALGCTLDELACRSDYVCKS